MDELKRRAMARLPMSPAGVREAYAASGGSPHARRVVRELCESHERLRAELEGTAALLRDAEAEVLRLRNKMARMAVAFRLGMVVNNVKSDGLTAIAAELEKEGRADGTT